MAMRQSDEFLVEEALHYPDAFAELEFRYRERIYNLAYRVTGEADNCSAETTRATNLPLERRHRE